MTKKIGLVRRGSSHRTVRGMSLSGPGLVRHALIIRHDDEANATSRADLKHDHFRRHVIDAFLTLDLKWREESVDVVRTR